MNTQKAMTGRLLRMGPLVWKQSWSIVVTNPEARANNRESRLKCWQIPRSGYIRRQCNAFQKCTLTTPPSVCELQKKEQGGQGSSEGQIGVVGFLERGQLAPAPLAMGLGSATSAINGVPGFHCLTTNNFLCLLSIKRKFPWYICNSVAEKTIYSTQFCSSLSGGKIISFLGGGEFPPPQKKAAWNEQWAHVQLRYEMLF